MNTFLALSLSDVVFIMFISVKMTIKIAILTFMSRINSMLSSVEHEKNLKPGGYKMSQSQRISLHSLEET